MSEEKMAQLLQHVKAIVWDYDGVHYDYAIFPALATFNDVRTRTAMRVIPSLTEAQACQIGEEGYRKYGDAVQGYTLWAQANGHDAEAIREQIFKSYHSDLFNLLVRDYPNHIAADADTIDAFHRCAPVVQHGIATHSSIEHWTRPFLKRQNLLQFFNENALIGLDDVDYAQKTKSIAAILQALAPLVTPAPLAAFAEDTLANLRYAHDNIPGLTTIFIHHGRPLKVLPDFITLQAKNPAAVMQTIARAHGL